MSVRTVPPGWRDSSSEIRQYVLTRECEPTDEVQLSVIGTDHDATAFARLMLPCSRGSLANVCNAADEAAAILRLVLDLLDLRCEDELRRELTALHERARVEAGELPAAAGGAR